jgi:hypothetical protein
MKPKFSTPLQETQGEACGKELKRDKKYFVYLKLSRKERRRAKKIAGQHSVSHILNILERWERTIFRFKV